MVKNPRYVNQVRVSSTGQASKDTPEVQRHELEAWSRREPGRFVEQLEHVGTGTAGLKDRPDLQRLKQLSDAKAFDELRLYSVSRASRSEDVLDQVEVFSLCQRAGAIIRTCNGSVYDPADPFAVVKWMIDIGAAAGDRKQILKNTISGKARTMRAGGKPAGPTRFGLDYDRETRKWTINETHAKVVRDIFAMCLKGMGAPAILRRLNDLGASSPKGNGWARSSVLEVLHSRVFIGEYIYKLGNEPPTTIKVPAIVSFDLWEQAQEALKNRLHRPQREGYASEALVRHYAICGVCERPMHVWMHSRKRAEKGRAMYRCSSIQRGTPCGNRGHHVYMIDATVWAGLVEVLKNQQRLARMSKKKPQKETWREKIVEFEARLAQIRKDEARVFKFMSAGLGEDAGREQLEELASAKKRTQRALEEAKRCLEDEAAAVIALNALQSRVALMKAKLNGAATFQDRRELLVAAMPLGGKVVIHRDGLVDLKSIALSQDEAA